MTNHLIALAAAGLLFWHWRKKRGMEIAPNTGKKIVEAGIPSSGDTEATWWDKFHGKDIALVDYQNGFGGVSPDPGSVGKAQIANSVNLAWNGDLTP